MPEPLTENPAIPNTPATEVTNPIIQSVEAPNNNNNNQPTPPVKQTGQSSKKGLLITALVGVSAIIILGFLTLSIQNSTKQATTVPQATSQKPTPTQEVKGLAMEVNGVNNGEVVTSKTLKINGNTNLPAAVTVTGGTEDILVDSNGRFTTNVTLNNGENNLVFTAIDANENQVVTTMNVFLSTEAAQWKD